jgi:putative membrane protein insertion efficiency factor
MTRDAAPTAHLSTPGHPERSEGSAVALHLPAPETTPESRQQPQLPNHAHHLYKTILSPALHVAATTFGLTGSCRFQPTCSDYATLAIAQHGPLRGTWMALRRLLRCHPFTRGGWDPVPPARSQPAEHHRPS